MERFQKLGVELPISICCWREEKSDIVAFVAVSILREDLRDDFDAR